MELFEEIRREYYHGSGTIKGVADKLGVHRRMVRQALASAVPPPAKERERQKPVLSELVPFIDQILEADRQAPRKQQHTAHRIWVRAQGELGVPVSESTICKYVRRRKEELEIYRRETFVPQCYLPGREGQVDWYEAYADFGAGGSAEAVPGSSQISPAHRDAERIKVQVFAMRAMYSGAAFHIAFPRATQQAFLEAHEAAFGYFGGVFHTLRYDNLTSAVKKILRGHRREETQRFRAFRSHWGYSSQFCNPARGNEKGGVEGEVGYCRRNHLVPVPLVGDWAGLNQLLWAACVADGARCIGERTSCVDALWDEERSYLQPLAGEGFDLAEVVFARVDTKGCVRAKTNHYSTPLRPGTRARVVLRAGRVEVYKDHRLVAFHVRDHGRHRHVLQLEHYLDVLERKPGALAGSTPLAQARAQGRWPACFDVLWQRLQDRHGQTKGTQQLIELLLFSVGRTSQRGEKYTREELRHAVERALEMGTVDVGAIRLLLEQHGLRLLKGQGSVGPLKSESLTPIQQAHFERPLPDMGCYDQLCPSSFGSCERTAAPSVTLRLVTQAQQEVA